MEVLRNSAFGLAIYDRRLRFVAVNAAVAAMDHVPVEEHLGRETSEIVGAVSRIIEPRVERAFRTGEPLNRYELSAKLPTRKDVAHWIEDFIPITDDRGRVREVGVIAVEITAQKRLEAMLRRLRRSVRAGTKIHDERTLLALAETAVRYDSRMSRNLPPGSILTSPAAELPSAILSTRQLEVLRLLAQGKSNKEVASATMISEKTVETHRSRLMLKLGLRSLVDLTRYAIRHGIVEP
jgi:DNA-binding CsgD family transcriptional regulator